MEKTTNSLSLIKTYKASAAMLWKVITDREHLKQWYFDFTEDWKLETGSQFDWYAGDNDGKQWQHRGVMLEIIPNQKLVHSWEYVGYSGTSVVTWELRPIDENNTELHFSHVFTVPFDVTEPGLARENFEKGWNHILTISLPDYIEKQTK
ncbi:SRPBCC family protein [Flavobacterium phycosphaerae]|uniref:SRPBCC family protein n=1 Tax=Flavobacterium phycosphaerae TaxID=2697515 RepID=UPI00138B0F4A|nr:SRPBCC domain-containing protein [Flavobacterium phycosphaerae]